MIQDLISRQAAIDVLEKGLSKIPYMNNTDEDMIRRDERISCIQEVRTLPSAQPDKDLIHLQKEQAYMQGYEDGKKSRKGKWIDETFKPWGPVFHPYKCDQCGEHSEAPSNFCPNCGAEMCQIEGGEEE